MRRRPEISEAGADLETDLESGDRSSMHTSENHEKDELIDAQHVHLCSHLFHCHDSQPCSPPPSRDFCLRRLL